MPTPLADIPNTWLALLFDIEFAESHFLVEFNGPRFRNPVVERIMPSLLHLKAAAVFDHAIEAWLGDRGISLTKPYRETLDGRISYLADHGHLSDSDLVHAIRRTRNSVAHEPEPSVDWMSLRADVATLNAAMMELGIVGMMPTFKATATQHAAVNGMIPDALTSQKFDLTVTASNGTRKVLGWVRHSMKD